MPDQTREVSPGPDDRSVHTADGRVLRAPDDWSLLEPGDATLTRRVKLAGPTWTVREKVRRRMFSRGVWAPRERIERLRAELATERDDPAYQKQLETSRRRRGKLEQDYVGDFVGAVRTYLAFDARYEDLAEKVAAAIAAHATPVGSGTVARTKRIPIQKRAESATIAWLRHQTTGYDSMPIPRVKGKRREVRKMFAEHSRELLRRYRHGEVVDPESCALRAALADRPAAEQGE